MPIGEIGKEFTDTLASVGKWVKQFGHTIYGTRGGPMKPEKWGVTTQDAKQVYLHIFEKPENGIIEVPGNYKSETIKVINHASTLSAEKTQNGLKINVGKLYLQGPSTILVLIKN